MNKKFLQSLAIGVMGLSLVASCSHFNFGKKESNNCGAKNGCAASKKESHKCSSKAEKAEKTEKAKAKKAKAAK